MREVATQVGCSYSTVAGTKNDLDLVFTASERVANPSAIIERLERMISLRQEGKTLDEIAKEVSLTRERVRQVLKKLMPDYDPKAHHPRPHLRHCGRPTCVGKNLIRCVRRIRVGYMWNSQVSERNIEMRSGILDDLRAGKTQVAIAHDRGVGRCDVSVIIRKMREAGVVVPDVRASAAEEYRKRWLPLIALSGTETTIPEAARKLGRSCQTTYSAARSLGLDFARGSGGSPLPTEVISSITNLSGTGITIREAATKLPLPYRTVYNLARRLGLDFVMSHASPVGNLVAPLSGLGLTIREAAERLGLTYRQVYRDAHRRPFDFVRDRSGGHKGSPKRDRIIELSGAGLTVSEAAAAAGANYSTVLRIKRELGLDFVPGHRGITASPPDNLDEMISLRREGKSLSKIGTQVGLHQLSVCRILKKYMSDYDGKQAYRHCENYRCVGPSLPLVPKRAKLGFPWNARVSEPQLNTGLFILRRIGEGATQTAIAEEMGMGRSNVSSIVARMRERGLSI
jgi:DNA-binding transcriptional MerR regulator